MKIDDGQWQPATVDSSEEAEFAWKIWHLDWDNPAPGEHTVTRAPQTRRARQPAMDDPWIVQKKTYGEQWPGYPPYQSYLTSGFRLTKVVQCIHFPCNSIKNKGGRP